MVDTKLITFLTLLEEKSYTKTAQKLYITQPAVTHHIKSLEKEYEITLFSNAKSFELTKSGKMLLEYAKNLKLQDELLMTNLKKQANYSLNVGFTPMVSGLLPDAEVTLKTISRFPNINAYTYSYDEIQEFLLSGKLDFAVIDDSFDSSLFESIVVANENIVLVGDPNGQFKEYDSITVEDISKATLISSVENCGLYKGVLTYLKSQNIQFKNNFIIESNNPILMKKMILLSDALSFMYYDQVKDEIQNGKLKQFDIPFAIPQQSIYIVYSKAFTLDDTMQEFVELVSKLGR